MKYFAKIKKPLLLLFVAGCLLQACKKDPGNYSYKELNEGIVSNLDSFYTVKPGNILHIEPKIAYTKDQVGDTINYEYSWHQIDKDDGVMSYRELKTMAKGSVLNIRIKEALGVYKYTFRVTDKKTGVWKEFPFKVLVANEVYEGWLLLSEVSGGQSRLDMLSYKEQTKKYEFIPDVLTFVKSAFKLKGKPSFVARDYSKIVIGTSEVAASLGTDSLEYDNYSDFSWRSMTRVNVALGIGSKMESGSTHQYLWANGNVYTEEGSAFYAVSQMLGSTVPFKAAPFVSYDRNWVPPFREGAILFDETSSAFVWHPNTSSRVCVEMENESLFKNKIDKNLLYMKFSNYNKGAETFAVLKNKTDNKIYLARFTSGRQNYFAEINNTLMAQAEQFEVSDDFGYIFYSVGGKLYEYDFNEKVNKEMADYGNRKISFLKFQNIDNRFISRNGRYQDIIKRLCVCTYEEGKLDNSGTMDLYSVSPAHGPLVKAESFSGMGKIVSIAYLDR